MQRQRRAVPANRHQDRRRHRVDLPDRRGVRRPYAGETLGDHQEAGADPPVAPRPHQGRLLCRHDLGGAGPERGHRAGSGYRLAGRPQYARGRQAGNAQLDEQRGRRIPPHLFDRPEISRDGRAPGPEPQRPALRAAPDRLHPPPRRTENLRLLHPQRKRPCDHQGAGRGKLHHGRTGNLRQPPGLFGHPGRVPDLPHDRRLDGLQRPVLGGRAGPGAEREVRIHLRSPGQVRRLRGRLPDLLQDRKRPPDRTRRGDRADAADPGRAEGNRRPQNL